MQRDLSDLTKEQSDLFLDQFHGALRRRTGLLFEGEGSAGFRDGIFESELTGPMETQAGVRILVTWRLRQLPDGRLISIEATGSDSGQEIEIQAFVGDVLTAVLSNKSREFAIRRFFRAVHHANLNGEYWIGGFRFAPLYPDDASSLINAERMLVVDQKVEAVDQAHANELADERAGLAGAQLTLLTGVGLSEPVHEHRWVVGEESGAGPVRRSTWVVPFERFDSMPAKSDLCRAGEFRGSVFDCEQPIGTPFCCPTETRAILRGVKDAEPQVRNAFNKCARLYAIGQTLGRYHPTVRIAYEWGALESIVKTLGSQLASSAGEFIRATMGPDVGGLVDAIHGQVRSAHWHSGEFALGETDRRRDFITDPSHIQRYSLLRDAHQLLRTCIFKWVMRDVIDYQSERRPTTRRS